MSVPSIEQQMINTRKALRECLKVLARLPFYTRNSVVMNLQSWADGKTRAESVVRYAYTGKAIQ